ncbi:MAG TPA: FAD:protein FMN transferase, partial [Xanthomonadales bacterium]|nr:FAD:protein FMN transferase [Xanthomonadales bacterium]
AARAVVGWDKVEWRAPRLRLPAGMRFDLGGVAKEYAADRAAEACRAAGIDGGLVVLGGDVAVVGPRADGEPWRVGVADPSASSRARRTLPVERGGFATSGDYERCMVVDGRRYSHLVDVVRGEPVRGYASVSVAAPNCLVAGALATVAMLAGIEEGAALLERSGADWLAIAPDGTLSGPLA